MYKKYFFLIIFLLSYSLLSAQVKQDKINKETTKPTGDSEVKNLSSAHLLSKNMNTTAAATSYDFTVPGAAYKPGVAEPMTEVETGVFAMISGDGDASGAVDATDQNTIWRPDNGQPWAYSKTADFNLDGNIDATDINLYWRPNNGKSTQVP